MRCRLSRFPLTKAVPLAISRGTTAAVEHLLLELEHDGITGLGETGGFDTGPMPDAGTPVDTANDNDTTESAPAQPPAAAPGEPGY
jgi:L-alanine-DL-glutamate epimerase-like enolase superfamily enzyme